MPEGEGSDGVAAMMSCREVTGLVASDELAEARWARRLVVRLHLLMCLHCRRYVRQLHAIGACARKHWGPQAEDSETFQRLERDILERVKRPPEGSV